VSALIGRRRPDWARTPKFGIADAQGTWRGKAYAERASWSALIELALGVSSALFAWDLWADGANATAALVVLYAVGFLSIGGLTLAESLGIARERGGVATRVPLPASRATQRVEVKAA
jgi:hypothetical protein